jgi:hypothetical protein
MLRRREERFYALERAAPDCVALLHNLFILSRIVACWKRS